jgi:arginine/lysine/ornithine decarboxylase
VRDFRKKASELKNLAVVKYDDMEESKIVILSKKEGFTGEDLLVNLREKYHLELEMASGQYALAMTTIMDDEYCLSRLLESLKLIDKAIDGHRDCIFSKDKGLNIKSRPEKVMEIYEVKDRQKEKISLDESEGRISYNEVCVYPPGVADLLPGEKISKDMIEYIKNNIENGFEVEGIESNSIYVLREF